ncbi:MAG TPA: RnfABCDGE type electron transport complex subunit G [Desulfobacteraceae bacterium]|mgnify:CR=1 FL=1|nr:RnfABCDGE type electron transport complex subunit G [Desulfobacteraceae bacterium]
MREMLKLFLTIVVFSAVAGGLLATVRSATRDRIEFQQLVFVKGPTIRQIMQGSSNDPVEASFKLLDGDVERTFFAGEFDGSLNTVALETYAGGYGGEIGVVAAINVETDRIVGVGVTTHSETPGLGSRAKTDPSFSRQFEDKPVAEPFKVKADGGAIDALSGATITSRGVCQAVSEIADIYIRLKDNIIAELKS